MEILTTIPVTCRLHPFTDGRSKRIIDSNALRRPTSQQPPAKAPPAPTSRPTLRSQRTPTQSARTGQMPAPS
eukprot:970292-Prymnesium_polylepis.1